MSKNNEESFSLTHMDMVCLSMKIRRLDELDYAIGVNEAIENVPIECERCPCRPECWAQDLVNSFTLHGKLEKATGLRTPFS